MPAGTGTRDCIPCYVINLDAARERRAAMAGRLAELGVPFTLFRAIDGRQLTPEQRALHVDEARAGREGYPLSPGEIGCALSHLSIYRKMANEGIPYAVVLEDDVCLAPDFARLLDRAEPEGLASLFPHEEPAMVQLTHVRRSFRRGGRPVLGERRAVRPHGGVWLASAYFITLGAARRMAEGLHPVWTVADHWRRMERAGLLRLHALSPNCAWASEQSRESCIGSGRSRFGKNRSAATRIKRWIDDLVVRPFLVERVPEIVGSASDTQASRPAVPPAPLAREHSGPWPVLAPRQAESALACPPRPAS